LFFWFWKVPNPQIIKRNKPLIVESSDNQPADNEGRLYTLTIIFKYAFLNVLFSSQVARQQRVVLKQQHQQQQQQQLLKTNFKTVQENVESKNWPLEEFTAKKWERKREKKNIYFCFKRKNDEDIVC
jgi:hypothetical protein